jgi:hypothetical protein
VTNRHKYAIGVVLFIALAISRIVPTYSVFNNTTDEPAHIACGMEWLQFGTYTYEVQHPPLARVAVALGPFLKGLRLEKKLIASEQRAAFIYEEGNTILYSGGRYWSNLTWARLGTLPFLVLVCVVTFLWARRWFSDAAGFWAVLLLTCASPILGHAGLATNDVACAAGTSLALYQFLRWLEQPRPVHALLWGFATAIAVLCKFSAIPFLLACYAAGLASLVLTKQPLRRRFAQVASAICIALFVMWACYRFTVVPLVTIYGPHPRIDGILGGHPLFQSIWNAILAAPLPLTEAMLGVRDLYRHNAFGHDSYLLGHWSQSGWWYFFPVVLAVKTPIGLLLLALSGFGVVLARRREVSLQQLLTVVFAIAILSVCMLARIDLGVRHILPIYPLFAIAGGHAVTVLFRYSRPAVVVAALLIAWTVVDSWRAHPDYLAHFNEIAGSRPEAILCESDLDWGQDLDRLRKRLNERGITEFSIAYFGSALLDKADLPHYSPLSGTQPSSGYVAVSLHFLNIEYGKNGSFAWLKSYTPVERIGKSIDLFYIPK